MTVEIIILNSDRKCSELLAEHIDIRSKKHHHHFFIVYAREVIAKVVWIHFVIILPIH